MAVTTYGRENWCPKIKCNRLLPLDKSHKFHNLYKVNTCSKTTKYRSHSHTPHSYITVPTPRLIFFFKKFPDPLQIL